MKLRGKAQFDTVKVPIFDGTVFVTVREWNRAILQKIAREATEQVADKKGNVSKEWNATTHARLETEHRVADISGLRVGHIEQYAPPLPDEELDLDGLVTADKTITIDTKKIVFTSAADESMNIVEYLRFRAWPAAFWDVIVAVGENLAAVKESQRHDEKKSSSSSSETETTRQSRSRAKSAQSEDETHQTGTSTTVKAANGADGPSAVIQPSSST